MDIPNVLSYMWLVLYLLFTSGAGPAILVSLSFVLGNHGGGSNHIHSSSNGELLLVT